MMRPEGKSSERWRANEGREEQVNAQRKRGHRAACGPGVNQAPV